MKFTARSHNLVLSGSRSTVVSRSDRSALATLVALLPVFAAGSFAALTVIVFSLLAIERYEFNAYQNGVSSVQVNIEMNRPTPSQESVDVAMAAFSVNGGAHVNWPIFDASLADRGLTTGGTLDMRRSISVGTPAFTSWGVLGSTLGHEIEVHGNQSFVQILALDGVSRMGKSALALVSPERADASISKNVDDVYMGTLRAERAAYLYEVASAKRYGLRSDEVASILMVMNTYYSDKSSNK